MHAVGGRLCVDDVAYARIVWSMSKPAALMSACYFYKVFGPHYVVLWAISNSAVAQQSQPFFIGAEDLPYKLQPATWNFELSLWLCGIRDYLPDVAQFCGDDGNCDSIAKMQVVYGLLEIA